MALALNTLEVWYAIKQRTSIHLAGYILCSQNTSLFLSFKHIYFEANLTLQGSTYGHNVMETRVEMTISNTDLGS